MNTLKITNNNKIISLITLFLISILLLGGCTPTPTDTENNNNQVSTQAENDVQQSELNSQYSYTLEDIKKTIAETFYSTIDVNEIQSFLDSQSGILKDYSIDNRSAAELIDTSAIADLEGAIINQKILIILLELKSHVVTNPNVTKEELKNIMGITQEQYINFFKEKFSYFLENEGISTESRIKQLNTNTFLSQLEYIGEKLESYQNEADYANKPLTITFKDTSIINAPENVNSRIFAIEKVLAELADSQEQWNHWVSKDPGSFYDLYARWFLSAQLPAQAKNDVQQLEDIKKTIAGSFHLPIELNAIQKFLESQPGILKNYTTDEYGELTSAYELIDTASLSGLGANEMDQRILIVILELKTGVITDSEFDKNNLKTIFEISHEEYVDFFKKEYSYFLENEGISIEERLKKINTNTFLSQMQHIIGKLKSYLRQIEYSEHEQKTPNFNIIFQDGYTINAPENVNSRIFAIEKVLAELADSQEQWNHWVSKDPDSFYDLYARWFLSASN